MIETARYSGLCETCDRDLTCTLKRSTQLRIVRCQDFKPHSSPPAGLCANCRSVDTCSFPNARQGVMTCEKYVLAGSAAQAI